MLPQRHNAAHNVENLRRYGTADVRSVGYKSVEEAKQRYGVMLDVIREPSQRTSLLDIGCGLANLLDHIHDGPFRDVIEYTGVDISGRYIAEARRRHPDADLRQLDVLQHETPIGEFDYVIINGLFNQRGAIPYPRWFTYWQDMVTFGYAHARRGLAFNAMSTIVDWQRDDLFHLPFDAMAEFVAGTLSRDFVIRHDYAGYEYAVYVYRST